MIPPIIHTCCGTPCFQEYESEQDKDYICWGNIYCICSGMFEDDEGNIDEYRYGSCEGHEEVWHSSTWDKSKYVKPK